MAISSEKVNAIEVKGLTYKHNSYSDKTPPALVDLSLSLPKGSRTLLIGANGGKPCRGWPRQKSLTPIQRENPLYFKSLQESVSSGAVTFEYSVKMYFVIRLRCVS
jgi:hypothetical protein